MNTFRIRVVLLKPDYGVGTEFIYAIQLSGEGLNWWTVARYKGFDECLHNGRQLEKFLNDNRIIKEDKVLWSTNL